MVTRMATMKFYSRKRPVQQLLDSRVTVDNFSSARDLFIEGLNHIQDQEYEDAERKLRASLALVPQRISTLTNLSFVLIKLRKYSEAEKLLEHIVEIDETSAEAWLNYGLIEMEQKRNDLKAIEYFDRALAINPSFAEAWLNRGVALNALKRHQDAVDSYKKAIAVNADYAVAYSNLANTYRDLGQHRDAVANYDKAFALKPELEDSFILFGSRLHAKLNLCDWGDLPNQISELTKKIESNKTCATPFLVLALSDSLALQKKAAENWVKDEAPASLALARLNRRPKSGKIRLGYFSSDFRVHPVSIQTAGLFEKHDRSRFELTAFSFGRNVDDEMTKRIGAAFDRFIDVRARSDKDVALLARELEIDIAVDLGGLTDGNRTKIFAMRAAPLQVSYLGYAGTMGAEYIDFLLADRIVIPAASRQYYREKIAYLPNSFFVNDRGRATPEMTFSREELGLPATGFVFCCFNHFYKINPDVFHRWMRILGKVEGSVLWLPEGDPAAVLNLRRESEASGIRAARLIFAKRTLRAEAHLARLRAADLFLDTLPYNAHSTASDTLWAGVPVLTCTGNAFAGRVAASLLNAIHLSELIAGSPQEYETLAIELATNPDRLNKIREKLRRNRLTTPLFDTELFARHIENAYLQMYERYHAGLPPEHIHVDA